MSGSNGALPLLREIDRTFNRGPAVPCRSGCTGCCYGPFDISPADAALVAEGVASLGADERTALLDRAHAQLLAYGNVLPHWGAPFDVNDVPDETFDAFTEALAGLPCPALGAEGNCILYAHRPSTCRLMGRAWVGVPDGAVLDNACPIQDQFPGYASIPPTPLDLERIEESLATIDERARHDGFVVTTVAGAITR